MARPTDISPLSQLLRRVDALAEGAPVPDTIPTRFPTLDHVLGGGFRRGDLIVLGGDVGAGKSALALAIALRAAAGSRAVVLLAAETPPQRVLERALAIEGRTTIESIRRGRLDEEARVALRAAALRLRHVLPRIETLRRHTVAEVIEQGLSPAAPELLVIDSLQAIGGDRTQDETAAHAVRALKEHATAHDVAILLTAHLAALPRTRTDMRPTLDDFGVLGAVKQHADIVLGLFREALYERAPGRDGAAELAVLKHRDGATTFIDLFFHEAWLRFEDMVDPDQ